MVIKDDLDSYLRDRKSNQQDTIEGKEKIAVEASHRIVENALSSERENVVHEAEFGEFLVGLRGEEPNHSLWARIFWFMRPRKGKLW
ncbi:hypothetical protein Dda_3420 [Drechslerella dactyloides]|uniref:Uncharacterized protein n=1 Tax=Drechslerella dactyloides TaxID=74499 RepID=A0AAD6J2X3_DREDA|nr:hypothetical protein Dda_3420 [Drechslerella dactyloides]